MLKVEAAWPARAVRLAEMGFLPEMVAFRGREDGAFEVVIQTPGELDEVKGPFATKMQANVWA